VFEGIGEPVEWIEQRAMLNRALVVRQMTEALERTRETT
jgi:hypothetical protein